jgi:hypothetical protein
MDSEEYKSQVVCQNCGFNNYALIPKGTPIREAPCPNCGCKTLRPFKKLDAMLGDIGSLEDPFNELFHPKK